MRSTKPYEWVNDYNNVTRLGWHLTHEMFLDIEQLQAYYEKPWNWTPEWEYLQKHGDLEHFEEQEEATT